MWIYLRLQFQEQHGGSQICIVYLWNLVEKASLNKNSDKDAFVSAVEDKFAHSISSAFLKEMCKLDISPQGYSQIGKQTEGSWITLKGLIVPLCKICCGSARLAK